MCECVCKTFKWWRLMAYLTYSLKTIHDNMKNKQNYRNILTCLQLKDISNSKPELPQYKKRRWERRSIRRRMKRRKIKIKKTKSWWVILHYYNKPLPEVEMAGKREGQGWVGVGVGVSRYKIELKLLLKEKETSR